MKMLGQTTEVVQKINVPIDTEYHTGQLFCFEYGGVGTLYLLSDYDCYQDGYLLVCLGGDFTVGGIFDEHMKGPVTPKTLAKIVGDTKVYEAEFINGQIIVGSQVV